MNPERGFGLHPLAAEDIVGIWTYIAADSPRAARRVREEILGAIRALVAFPQQGYRRPDSPRAPCDLPWCANT